MSDLTEYILRDDTPLQYAAIGLNKQMLPVFLGLLLAASVAWLYLSNRLYMELRKNHPRLYETLGRPGLFMKKSLAVNFRVIRFVFKQDYGTDVGPAVVRLCHGLRCLFSMYIICLSGCLLILFAELF